MQTKIDALIAYDRFWLVDPAFAETAKAILAATDITAGIETDRGAETESRLYEVLPGGIARIQMQGPITKKDTSMAFWFGGTSSIRARRAVQAAVRDETVNSIAIVVDSPGGQTAGTAELAAAVREAAKAKKVTTYISDQCCSAALWVAAQSTEIVANEMAMIGSIGCYTTVWDSSRAAKSAGIDVSLVTTGDLKGQGVQGVPVSAEYIAETQKMVDAIKDKFVADVALGRGMSIKDVEALATGAVWIASEAKALGLIDRVATEDEVLTQLQRGGFSARAVAAGIQETHMVNNPENQGFLARFGASVLALMGGGSPSEQEGASAGPNPAAPNPTTTVTLPPIAGEPKQADLDPAVKERLAEIEASNQQIILAMGQSAAENFAASVISANKAFPSEKQSAMDGFLLALKADGGGNVKCGTDGKPLEGENCAAIRKIYEDRPAHTLTEEKVRGAASGVTLTLQSSEVGAELADVRSRYFGATPDGQKILESEKK